jgi:hypothetical protein
MKLEAVCRVSVSDLSLEVCRQVDNADGAEGAFLGANTATDTQALRDEGDFRVGRDFYAELAASHDGARFLALLTAFLRFALWVGSWLAVALWSGGGVAGQDIACE